MIDGRRWPNWIRGLLWTSPWWLGFLLFLAGPMAISLYISFCDYPLLQPPMFVGTDNYTALAADPVFHKVLGNTLIYAALALPLTTVTAVLLACLLNQPLRGQAIWRTCVFVPTIVPVVAVGVIWGWLLNPEYGLINGALRMVGVEGPNWVGSPFWTMASIVLASVWSVGTPVVIYLAAMQDIPDSQYEAALLDGAGPVRRFLHVTVPGISPAILFNVIIGLITAWQVFALPYVLLKGTPGISRSGYFYTTYLFESAFRYLKMGYASAMGWIQFVIILALTGLLFAVSRRVVHYRGA